MLDRLLTSNLCNAENLAIQKLINLFSKSLPPSLVLPDDAMTSNIPSSTDNSVTSNVPPPKSYTMIVNFLGSGFSSLLLLLSLSSLLLLF